MSCIANEKKFLFFKWFGRHDWKVTRIGRFMLAAESSKFMAAVECKKCGMRETGHFLTEEDLINLGVTRAEIVRGRDIEF
jgi:hypothetical protein